MTRVAVLRDTATPTGIGQFAVIQYVALSLGVEVIPINLRNAPEVERAVTAFARTGNDGLIVTAGPLTAVHRNLITTLATRHKLPAIYSTRFYATAGGLVSYGSDFVDQYRRAASYVDRILKGEKPGIMAYWDRLGATVPRIDDQDFAIKAAEIGSGNQARRASANY